MSGMPSPASVGPLLAVRISIPVPDELQIPLAVVGGLILVLGYVFIGAGLIRENRRSGWCWVVSTAAIAPFLMSIVWVFGRDFADEAAPGVLPLAGFALLAAGGMAGAQWWRSTALLAGVGAAVLGLKPVVRPLMEPVIVVGQEIRFVRAPIIAPTNLALLCIAAALVGLALFAIMRAREAARTIETTGFAGKQLRRSSP